MDPSDEKGFWTPLASPYMLMKILAEDFSLISLIQSCFHQSWGGQTAREDGFHIEGVYI